MEKQQYDISGGNNQVAPGATQAVQNIFLGSQSGEEFARRILEKGTRPISLVITGNGADATMGIPTSKNLISHITEFLETQEGKDIDSLLRKSIGNVRFHFHKFVNQAIERLTQNLDRRIIIKISEELESNPHLTDSQRKTAQLIISLFQKMCDIMKNATIDTEMEGLIFEVIGEEVKDETIIDLSHLNYTETFKSILAHILQRSIRHADDPILSHVYHHTFDIEHLLVDHFYGFYSGKSSLIRSYLYISWILWSYLVLQERRIAQQHSQSSPGTIYSQLQQMAGDIELITFNYTTFAHSICPGAHYFYGSIMQYLDVENKNEITIPNLSTLSPLEFITTHLQGAIRIEGDHPSIPIPSFLPHLKVLPFLSSSYIDTWYRAGALVSNATTILFLGYDFPHDNDFLHDKLRTTLSSRIILVDTDLEKASHRICRIMQISEYAFTTLNICGKRCRKYNNRITVVESDLEDINLKEILERV